MIKFQQTKKLKKKIQLAQMEVDGTLVQNSPPLLPEPYEAQSRQVHQQSADT